jgi:hypothetical protein
MAGKDGSEKVAGSKDTTSSRPNGNYDQSEEDRLFPAYPDDRNSSSPGEAEEPVDWIEYIGMAGEALDSFFNNIAGVQKCIMSYNEDPRGCQTVLVFSGKH